MLLRRRLNLLKIAHNFSSSTNMEQIDIAKMRKEYSAAGLDESDIPADPHTLFK